MTKFSVKIKLVMVNLGFEEKVSKAALKRFKIFQKNLHPSFWLFEKHRTARDFFLASWIF